MEEEEDGAEEGVGEGGEEEEAEALLALGHRSQHEGGERQRQDEQQTPAKAIFSFKVARRQFVKISLPKKTDSKVYSSTYSLFLNDWI